MCFRFDRLYIKRWTAYLEIGLNHGNSFIHLAIGPFKFQKRPEWITKDCRSLIVFFTNQTGIYHETTVKYIHIYIIQIYYKHVCTYLILLFVPWEAYRHTIVHFHIIIALHAYRYLLCILFLIYYMLHLSVYIQAYTAKYQIRL